MQLKPSLTPLAGRGRFGPFFVHVDLPMAVDMQQLHVVTRVLTASATPDAMMDLTVLLGQSQRLTAGHASSLLFLPEIFDLPVTCPRLGQLPTPPCFQVQFPLRIVGIDGAADLHVTNDLHLCRGHQRDRPALAFWVQQRAGKDPVAVIGSYEVFFLAARSALFWGSASAPPPHFF